MVLKFTEILKFESNQLTNEARLSFACPPTITLLIGAQRICLFNRQALNGFVYSSPGVRYF